jgi:hypothetical protein
MGWFSFASAEKLAPGYTNAKYLLLATSCAGDLLLGQSADRMGSQHVL